MTRSLLTILALTAGFTLLSSPAKATVTVVSVSGTDDSFASIAPGSAPAFTWTQTEGFSSVTITAPFYNGSSTAYQATAYLTNSLGPGTTMAANEIANASISVPTGGVSTLTLFTGLTLPPGTYYVVVFSATVPGGIGWVSSDQAPTYTTYTGVTTPIGAGLFATSVATYPPASNFGGIGPYGSFATVTGDPIVTPAISKSFGATSIVAGQTTSLSFTISNPNTSPAITLNDLSFTDSLPAGIEVASPNGLSGSCGGGTITANPLDGTVTLSGASLTGGTNCAFSVIVMGTGAAVVNNSVQITATESGAGNTATASLTVIGPPSIGKSFGASAIALNGTTSLSFAITNPNSTTGLTGVSFTDTLPAGLSASGTAASTCGTVTVTAGAVSLSNGAIAAGGSCSITGITVTGTTAGVKNNTTSNVTSNEGGTGNAASASVTVVAPPSISKSFGGLTVPLNGSTSLSFTVTNPNAANTLTGVAFTDSLPAGLAVSTPPGATGTCGGGTITATAGATSVSLAAASLAGSASCTFSVNVTGTTAGVKNNTTSAVTSNEGGSGNTASASVTVVVPPSISKSFGAPTVLLNTSTSLSFTITNSNPAGNITGIAFTDSLPGGLIVASPSGLTGSCGGGTITAVPRSASVSLSGATLSFGTSCIFSVNVTGTETGPQNNTVTVTSNAGTGNTSNASVTVTPAAQPPSGVTCPATSSAEVGVPFSSPAITVSGGTPPYTFSIVGGPANLPTGLTLNTSTGAVTGTPTAAGTFSVQATDSTATVVGSCPFTISLTLTSNAGFLVRYAANLNIGESYIDLTNTGANGAALLGPGYGTQSGNICVNVYAFDPGEELIACCSCLITPDQTVNLGVNRDLTVKTLTGVVPTSVTVKLLTSLAGGDGTGTSCTNSAATVTAANLAGGLSAWGTTLHADPVGAYDSTETPFTPSTLSSSELASIGGRCASVLGNGSGFGVCNSCRAGALGGAGLAQ